MTKTRNILLTILVSLFISGLLTYINELNQINKTISSVEYTVQTAVDMAIQQSIMSDDFYLKGFNYGSNSGINSSSTKVTNTELWVYGSSGNKNMLDAVMLYKQNGYNGMRYARSTEDIQNTAINGGGDFKKNAFKWQYNNPEFMSFYTWVRDTGYFKSPIYYLSGNEYKEGYVCSLDLMGLSEYGNVDNVSMYTNDTLGDQSRGGAIITTSAINEDVKLIAKKGYFGEYMITPTSLGITYINKDILEPVIKSNLEMISAYNYVKDTGSSSQLGNKHRGCLNSLAYYGLTHKEATGEIIVNNGLFEIDLSDVSINVSYKAIDMFNSSNNELLDLAFGAKPLGKDSQDQVNYTGDRAAFIKSQYNNSEASKYVIVAKVDVTVKIHIPFRSPLLQLYRSKESGNSNHLDIKAIDINTGNYDSSINSGTLYTYTTYVAVTP